MCVCVCVCACACACACAWAWAWVWGQVDVYIRVCLFRYRDNYVYVGTQTTPKSEDAIAKVNITFIPFKQRELQAVHDR